MKIEKSYLEFSEKLDSAKRRNEVEILYRGISTVQAFKLLNLQPELNSIEQYAEKLYFFGEKSKYFWNEIYPFELNEISKKVFKYIFDRFHRLSLTAFKDSRSNFFKKNKETTSFFSDPRNKQIFIENFKRLSSSQKLHYRNYYLILIHQLGESFNKHHSVFVSSSKTARIAQTFSKNGIVLKFWNPTSCRNRNQEDNNMPKFLGKPYKKQNETSIFGAIFPHFILSFCFEGNCYPNPALQKCNNFENAISSGFKIYQNNFFVKLLTGTKYKKTITKNGNRYE